MIAGPTAPGVGDSLYQPALDCRSVRGGTCTVPSALSPSLSKGDFTPSAGMLTATGADGGSTSPRTSTRDVGTTVGRMVWDVVVVAVDFDGCPDGAASGADAVVTTIGFERGKAGEAVTADADPE